MQEAYCKRGAKDSFGENQIARRGDKQEQIFFKKMDTLILLEFERGIPGVIDMRYLMFLQELAKGGPMMGGSTEDAEVRQDLNVEPKSNYSAKNAVNPLEKKKPVNSKVRRTISLNESFFARKEDLFACFTDPGRLKAFTGR